MNFLIDKWLFIVGGIFAWSFIYVLVKNIFPYIGREVRKITYIYGTYQLGKEIKKGSKRVRVELKIAQDDIEKELDLLRRIERHRRLHPDEKYLKSKFEKYLQLLKSLY